jgi:hypothetical protein
MKTRTIWIMAIVLAALINFVQWAWVMSGDGIPFLGGKTFTYGLPFMIVHSSPELSIQTPAWQVPFRLLGNIMCSIIFVAAFGFIGRFARSATAKNPAT